MLEKELDIAKKLATEAGIFLKNERNKIKHFEKKEDNTIVCSGDKEASKYICSELKKYFPDHGILDEENPKNDERDKYDYCWIIDPLDGTADYFYKGKNYGTLIGLIKNGVSILGVGYQPKQDKLYSAVKTQGAFLNNSKIKVSNSENIEFLTGGVKISQRRQEDIDLIKPDKISLMSTSFKIMEIANGNHNLFYNPPHNELSLWDICAGQVILEEAGGVMTDIYGSKVDYTKAYNTKNGIIATIPKLQDTIVERLSKKYKHSDLK